MAKGSQMNPLGTVAYRGNGLRNSRTAGLISQTSGANTYYYLSDGLGSTMKTVDATGTVVNGYTYDVYGKKTSSTGSQANEFDFAGQQTDATGLQYLRARYYDPATGAFLSRDPMAASPGWGGNSYSYASGNPVNATDPSGLAPFWNEATQRTEDDAQAGIFWSSATQGWQDIGSGATWSDAGGWSAAAPYVFQGPVFEPAPSPGRNDVPAPGSGCTGLCQAGDEFSDLARVLNYIGGGVAVGGTVLGCLIFGPGGCVAGAVVGNSAGTPFAVAGSVVAVIGAGYTCASAARGGGASTGACIDAAVWATVGFLPRFTGGFAAGGLQLGEDFLPGPSRCFGLC